jgi:hypothetical protein
MEKIGRDTFYDSMLALQIRTEENREKLRKVGPSGREFIPRPPKHEA